MTWAVICSSGRPGAGPWTRWVMSPATVGSSAHIHVMGYAAFLGTSGPGFNLGYSAPYP